MPGSLHHGSNGLAGPMLRVIPVTNHASSL